MPINAAQTPEAARAQGFALLDQADPEAELDQIMDVILAVADQRATFSANDVRPLLPEGVNHQRIGRAFALLSDRKLIRFVTYTRASHIAGHGRPVGLWTKGQA